MSDTSPTSSEGQICHQHHAESMQEPVDMETITVICPKHGEHEHAIVSNIEGHEGAWCQLCWLESLGPSLPYRKKYGDGTDS
jgi:hypothetical protein